MAGKKKTIKSLRLDPEMIAKVEKMAKKENRNFTNMVETLILKAIEPIEAH